jgi:protein SCO1
MLSQLRQNNRSGIFIKMNFKTLILLSLFVLGAGPRFVWAYEPKANHFADSAQVPDEIKNVGIKERLGEKIDLNLEFTNDSGEVVKLGHYFQTHKPVIMAMIYYSCPNLCNFQLNGMVDTFQKMKGQAGTDYEFVAISMDHTENSKQASAKKAAYLKVLNQPGSENGWHFLVGSEANVKAIAAQLGFEFKWSNELNQFAHAAATYVVTPTGEISRYLHGIAYTPETLRFSLVEASSGKIGSFIEQFALYCFQFNPAKNKYTLYAFRIMQIGAALTVLLLVIFIFPVWMKERHKKNLVV